VACVAPSLLGAVAAAAADRATICVENHWDQPLATAHEVDSALAGEPDLRACVDTGHAILAGCAPETFVRRLGARVAHVHLKEARRPTAPTLLLGRRLRRKLLSRPAAAFPGSGALDVAAVRTALDEVGFTGHVTLEHEGTDPSGALAALRHAWASTT